MKQVNKNDRVPLWKVKGSPSVLCSGKQESKTNATITDGVG